MKKYMMRRSLLFLSLAAFLLGPVAIGSAAYLWTSPPETTKKTVWIDPTNVATIDEDVMFSCMTEQPAAFTIEATTAHQTATGSGVVVAVLDGGFNLSHPFVSNNRHSLAWDTVDEDNDPEDMGNGIDDDWDGVIDNARGHGTFVAGMVLMAAPDATILPIRVVDDEGHGYEHDVYEGVLFAMNSGANVINLSLELVHAGSALEALLRTACERGITVVCAAGNQGESDFNAFADMDWTIAVGSTSPNDVVSEFSNRAEDTEDKRFFVFAPGEDLWGPYGWPHDNTVAFWSGTSFSAGIVSGAAALILGESPGASPKWVLYTLSRSTDPAYDDEGDEYEDFGRINLRKVVD